MALQGQQVTGERYNFRDLTGWSGAHCKVVERAANTSAGASQWKCQCLICWEVFSIPGSKLGGYAREEKFACPKCREIQKLESRRNRLKVGPQSKVRRERDYKAAGALSFGERKQKLAEALRTAAHGGGAEWRDGFTTACRVVERVLDVRVLED